LRLLGVIASPSLASKPDASIAGWSSRMPPGVFMPGSVRALTSRLCRRCLTAPPRNPACRAGRCGTSIDGLRFTLSGVLAKQKSLFRLSGLLKSVGVPTLVVVGEHDYVCSKASQLMAQPIPGATLKIIKNSGHMSPIEQPAGFTAVLLEFLQPAVA
jgi:pimeloyl-ACP methyl ester carboxylesterase